jgi:hypothetical protein
MRSTVSPIQRGTIAAVALVFSAVLAAGSPAYAQSASDRPAAQQGAGDKREPVQNRRDDIAEINRQVQGPAGNHECAWLGRRVLSRLWADDLDTAFRHLDLYDRFGCPGGYIQATFRCLVRLGEPDPKDYPKDVKPPDLNSRITTCWINPGQAQPSTTAQSPPEAGPAGTTTR